MRTFISRRRTAIIVTAVAAAGLAVYFSTLPKRLVDSHYASGWVLLVIILVLASYNLRKKLPFLPLLRSSTWLQIHIYLGFMTIALFIMHAGVRISGGLELTLAALYVTVAGSGVVGLFITRTFPRRLSVRGEELLFERMPIVRRDLHDRAADLAVRSVDETAATTIADFYRTRLAAYFAGFRHYWRHLIDSRRPLHEMASEIDSLDRYLSEKEKPFARELSMLVRIKDELDYQHALQKTLKGWLFIHIGFTYSLLIVAAAHVIVVYAFRGGV